jgi:ABC-type antimicrobial peptide transport system permease subunit
MLALLSGFFGLLAAVLTMVGLYGVISYLTVRRRNEIGIRMALGALRPQIVLMVLRDALRLLAIGIAVGATVSLIVGRSAGALLFGLEPSDPATLVASALLLSLTAVLAGLLPAWRAAKLDPVSALRQD